jgi:hypothetical protein
MRGFDDLAEAVGAVDAADPVEALRAGARRYVEFALAHPATYSVMFEQAVAGFVPSEEAILRACDCFEVLAGKVRRAMAAGAIVGDDATDVAQQVWSACHGTASLMLRGLGRAPDMQANHDRLVDHLLRGLAPPERG